MKTLHFRSLAVILFALTIFGCTNKSADYSVEYKIDGTYQVNFSNTQKFITTKTNHEYHSSIQKTVLSTEIPNKVLFNEIQLVDSSTNLIVKYYPKPDTINKRYKIKSTITLDTVIFHGYHSFFKNNTIDHEFKGHTHHLVTEIINQKDTFDWIAETIFNFRMIGKVKGKNNEFLLNYLIEKDLSGIYYSDIRSNIENANSNMGVISKNSVR